MEIEAAVPLLRLDREALAHGLGHRLVVLQPLVLSVEGAEGGILPHRAPGGKHQAVAAGQVPDLQQVPHGAHPAHQGHQVVHALLHIGLESKGVADRLAESQLHIHPLPQGADPIHVVGVDRLLEPLGLILADPVGKTEGVLHLPDLVAVHRDPDIRTHRLPDQPEALHVPVHVPAPVAAHLEFDGGVALPDIAGHIVHQLGVGQQQGTAPLVDGGPVLFRPQEPVQGLLLPLRHDLQHDSVELAQIADLAALEPEVAQLPVQIVIPLLIGAALAGHHQGEDVVQHPAGAEGPAAGPLRVIHLDPPL